LVYVAVVTPGVASKQHRSEEGSPDYILALDAASGQVKWKFDTTCCIHGISLAEGTIFFGDGRGVFALDAATQQVKWKFDITGENWLDGAPIYANDTLFFGDYGGNAYAIQGP
jgi:outer membrane protein assembly factor BamB